MKLIQRLNNIHFIIYFSIFIVTQVTGLLLSLVICFILQDFIWAFVRMALINSFILGLSLIGDCYLSQKLMFKMKTVHVISISFLLLLGTGIISFFIVLYLEPTLFIYYDRGAFSFLFVNFLFIFALYIISSGLIIYREIVVEKEKAISLERHLKDQMEMKLLSSKVNPHFLFNTLNMILTLLKQPAKAESALLNLSDLLRQNLAYSEKKLIPSKQEVENVRKYLEIQALRFGDKLHYNIREDADFPIPPLIIQPLVENSIKHNIGNVSHLTIDIALSRTDCGFKIFILDSEKKINHTMFQVGQGLTLTKKRVENNGGTFIVTNGGIEICFTP